MTTPKKGDVWQLRDIRVEWLRTMKEGDPITCECMLINGDPPTSGSLIPNGLFNETMSGPGPTVAVYPAESETQ